MLLLSTEAMAQILGTTAVRATGISASASFFVERFGFLDAAGFAVRGEMPVTSRFTPFVEAGAAQFDTGSRAGLPAQTETSWLLAAGTTVYGLDKRVLGHPLSVSGYSRLQFGNLKNIDLFCGQAMVLGTYDPFDRWPLALTLGAGISYRYLASDVGLEAKATENLTNPRFLLGLQWSLGQDLTLMGEFAYEDGASGGLGVRLRK